MGSETKPVSKWALHRRLYDWVLSFANHRHATTALFCLSFAESSFFPVPPDVLLGPMCLGARKRALWFAIVTTLGSVLGAYLGYYLGHEIIDVAVAWIPGLSQDLVDQLKGEFDRRGQMYVFIAALTPIPFKLLTITAGSAHMDLLVFTGACIVGRGVRFFGVAIVFWWIGPKAVPLIEKYFNWLSLAFVVLLVGGVAVVKWFK